MKLSVLFAAIVMTFSANAEIVNPNNIPEIGLTDAYVDTESAKHDAYTMCKALNSENEPSCIEVMHMEFYSAQVVGASYVVYNTNHENGYLSGDEASVQYMKDVYCAESIKPSDCEMYKELTMSNFVSGFMQGVIHTP